MSLILLAAFIAWDLSTSHGKAELEHNLAVSFGAVCLSLFVDKFVAWTKERK